jgi:hypothetical protein
MSAFEAKAEAFLAAQATALTWTRPSLSNICKPRANWSAA